MRMSENKFNLWLKEAKSDFKAGEVLLKQKIFHLAVFHFVQAGEKAIKALLYLNNTRPWGHSVTALLEEYEDLGKTVNVNVKNAALELEPHYIASSYPGDSMNTAPSDTYNAGDSKKLRDKAKVLL